MNERFDKIRPRESLRSMIDIVKVMGASALARFDDRLDVWPDDTLEEARIRSHIFDKIKVEAPVETEEELDGQLKLW